MPYEAEIKAGGHTLRITEKYLRVLKQVYPTVEFDTP